MEKHMVKKKQQKRVAEFTKPVGKKQRHQRQTKTTDIRCIINNYLAVPIIVRCMDCLKGQNSLIGLMLKQRFRKHLGKVDKDKNWAKITEEGENCTGQNYLPFLFFAIFCPAHMN